MIFKSAVKIARKPNDNFNLDTEKLLFNRNNSIRTSLLLDTNLLLGISNYMGETIDPRDNKTLAKYNLAELVNLCMFCQTNSVPYALSPGFCIPEVAPDNFEIVRMRYDDFFVLHNIQLFDCIETQSATPILETQNILSLPADEIKFKALPFLYICCMLLVNITEKNKLPAEKFSQFMNLIVEYVGYFSEK